MTNYEKAVELWKDKQIETGPELGVALEDFWLPYAYNSTRLENDAVTLEDTKEIFEHGSVTSYTGRLRTLLQILNAREAIDNFERAFDDSTELDEFLLQSMQYVLTQGTYPPELWNLHERPGEYKLRNYVSSHKDIGALPEDVEMEVRELMDELNGNALDSQNVLTAAAYYHAKLENIHPFASGNGRVGRLTMNYLLVTNDHPPLIIFEEDKDAYYAALKRWDTHQEVAALRDFLRGQVEKTWKKSIEAAN